MPTPDIEFPRKPEKIERPAAISKSRNGSADAALLYTRRIEMPRGHSRSSHVSHRGRASLSVRAYVYSPQSSESRNFATRPLRTDLYSRKAARARESASARRCFRARHLGTRLACCPGWSIGGEGLGRDVEFAERVWGYWSSGAARDSRWESNFYRLFFRKIHRFPKWSA